MGTSPRAVPNSEAQNSMQSKSVPPKSASGSLHPILKKPNTAPSPTHKTTRLLLEQPGDENITRNPSNPPTPNVVEIAPNDDTSTGRPPPKKAAYFTTGRVARGGKRRPVFNRRKSSQTSISKSPVSPRDRHVEEKQADSPDPIFDVDDDLSAPLDPQTETELKAGDRTSADIDLVPTITTTTANIITNKSRAPKHPEITPTVLEIEDKEDPILSQGIETVSHDPKMQEPSDLDAETLHHSSYLTNETHFEPHTTDETPVPEFTGAMRVPIPPSMMRSLMDIITDETSENDLIPAPCYPLHLFDHPWHPLPRDNYLLDYMIQGPDLSNPQPSNKPLVSKDFRAQWLLGLEEEEIQSMNGCEDYEILEEDLFLTRLVLRYLAIR